MAQVDIDESSRLSWVFDADQFPELSTFGIHTYLRDSEDFDALFDWMEGFCADYLVTVMCACTLRRVTVSGWSVGPGFTGYHQLAARDETLGFGSGNPAPHQDAWVNGYRNTTETGVALGRRRNRFYVGPIKASIIGTDSRMTSGLRDTMMTNLIAQHTELAGIPVAAGNEAFAGFSVVSPTEGIMMETSQFTLGRRYDVIRSRAEHVPEDVLATSPE
jgi:hypothetical protein